MLTDLTLFKGLISIPSLETAEGRALIDAVIEEREPEILTDLIGAQEYERLKNLDLNAPETTQEDKDLISRLANISAHFCWYWFSRENNSYLAAGGTTRVNNENATNVDPLEKQVLVWNKLNYYIFDIKHGIAFNCELPQIEVFRKSNIRTKYAKINTLNI